MTGPIDHPDASLIPTRGQVVRQRLDAATRAVVFFVVALAIIVGLWQAAIVSFDIKPFVVPTPVSVLVALNQDWPKLGAALGYTLRGTLLGLLMSTCLALVFATLFTLSDGVARAVMPLLIAIRTAPVLAIAPLLILIFGRGQAISIAVVVIVSFFPILVNATRGFRSTDANALELMHVCGATWLQTFFKVRLPFALPAIFTGLRAAATSGLLSAMLAEWLSGAPGLGTLILEAASFRKLPLMWAGVVLAMTVAFAIFALTVRMERSVVK
ncbi:MAG: ABC transporter permease subunit [Ancalomicrobiaceae bacterium]|nr:ABC transporter permease subunit [Ancalomicrobiaceae bacterium]